MGATTQINSTSMASKSLRYLGLKDVSSIYPNGHADFGRAFTILDAGFQTRGLCSRSAKVSGLQAYGMIHFATYGKRRHDT